MHGCDVRWMGLEGMEVCVYICVCVGGGGVEGRGVELGYSYKDKDILTWGSRDNTMTQPVTLLPQKTHILFHDFSMTFSGKCLLFHN